MPNTMQAPSVNGERLWSVPTDGTALETALELVKAGFWPIPLRPPGERYTSKGDAKIAEGKEPSGGMNWWKDRPTPEGLGKHYRIRRLDGVGVMLGKEAGLIDLEIDGDGGEGSLLDLMGGEEIATAAWESARGRHRLFLWDDRLEVIGKAKIELPELPGLEIRLGCGGRSQSAAPPSVGTNGRPRVWTGPATVAALPDHVVRRLIELAARRPSGSSNGKPTRPRSPGGSGRLRARAAGASPQEAWFRRALEYEAGKVENTKEPGRHDALRNAASTIFGQVCHGYLTEGEVTDALVSAGLACGLPEGEVRSTVDAGRLYGLAHPLAWPDRLDRPWEPPRTDATGIGAVPSIRLFDPPDDPHRLAREHLERINQAYGHVLKFWRNAIWRWEGSSFQMQADHEFTARLNDSCKASLDAEHEQQTNEKNPKHYRVTAAMTANVMQALKGMVLLPSKDVPSTPAWIGDAGQGWAAKDTLAFRDKLVHLPSILDGDTPELRDPTPLFFNTFALPFDFPAKPEKPAAWLDFLEELFPGDEASKELIQEWFGYIVSGDNSQEKMLAMIGPKRAGKGTIARILKALVGENNMAGPTLNSLASPFGLEPLLEKSLAVIDDARLGGRTDQAIVTETLLTISGKGTITVHRKHKNAITGELPTRIMLISNELPRIGDASGALSSRFLVLQFRNSFIGKEDHGLHARLERELPGILVWALMGLKRLRDRGRFVQPEAGRELVQELEELSSPVASFVGSECALDPRKGAPQASVECGVLYAKWREWCEQQGIEHPGDAANFGRKLKAAFPSVETKGVKRAGIHFRHYVGISLSKADNSDAF
jgi:putative DNA primase/helicase